MKAYSLDLRQRVVRAAHGGLSRPEIVQAFGVSLATLKRWLVLEKQDHLAPIPLKGMPRKLRPEKHPLLEAQLKAHPDAILDEHVVLWEQATGQHLSRATMARAILRLGYKRKKSKSEPASGTRL